MELWPTHDKAYYLVAAGGLQWQEAGTAGDRPCV